MKKLIYLLLFFPLLAQAQINGTIQKTVATGTVRGNFGSSGLDTLPRVAGVLLNGVPLIYNSVTNKYTTTKVGVSGVDTTVIRTVANSRSLAQTQTALNLKANLASPTFTGVPSAPTATAGTNTTQLATTAFVTNGIATSGYLPTSGYTGALSIVPSSFSVGNGSSLDANSLTLQSANLNALLSFKNAAGASIGSFYWDGTNMVADYSGGWKYLAALTGTSATFSAGVTAAALTSATSSNSVVNLFTSQNSSAGSSARNRSRFGNDASTVALTVDVYGSGVSGSANYTRITNQLNAPLILGANGGDNLTIAGSGVITLSSLAGTGTRMVVAGAGGDLSTQAIPGGGGGSVTGVAVATANGLAGTSDGAAVVPTLTLRTSVTGMVKGNGTALSAATAGTDYTTPSSTETFTNKSGNISQWTNNSGYITASSPALTGTPTAPTASAGTNTTQIATTAYVDALGAVSGSYTPGLTNETNITSSSVVGTATYSKVGNIVHISLTVNITPTASATNTVLYFALPSGLNAAVSSGSGVSVASQGGPAGVVQYQSSTGGKVTFVSSSTSVLTHYIQFDYSL